MKSIIKIIVVILFLLLGYNIYEYCISIEGWSDSQPDESSPYDISVSSSTAVSLPALDSSKTYTHTIDSFTKTAGASADSSASETDSGAAQTLWGNTGLSVGDNGQITGTTSSDANIDGVFAFQFTDTTQGTSSSDTVPKYLKIKITPENNQNTGARALSPTQPNYTSGDPSPSANACGHSGDAPTDACDMPEGNAQSACVAIEQAKDEMKTRIQEITNNANVKLEEIRANRPDSAANIIDSVGSAGSEIIGSVSQLTPWGAVSHAISEAGSTAREVFTSDTESQSAVNNIFDTTINSQNMENIETTCATESSTLMANSIDIGPCTPETMGVTPEIFSTLANAGKVGPFVDGVDQSIRFSSKMTCKMDAVMNSIMDGKSDIEKSAIQSAMADMQGSGHISTNQEACNEQSTTENSCSYISQKQCCSQVTRDIMTNSLNVASCFADINDIHQKVKYNSAASCGQVADASAFSRRDDSDSQTTKQVNETEETSIWPKIMIAAAVITGLIFIIYLIYKFGGNSKKSGAEMKSNNSASEP